jgi:hypothetical protein
VQRRPKAAASGHTPRSPASSYALPRIRCRPRSVSRAGFQIQLGCKRTSREPTMRLQERLAARVSSRPHARSTSALAGDYVGPNCDGSECAHKAEIGVIVPLSSSEQSRFISSFFHHRSTGDEHVYAQNNPNSAPASSAIFLEASRARPPDHICSH